MRTPPGLCSLPSDPELTHDDRQGGPGLPRGSPGARHRVSASIHLRWAPVKRNEINIMTTNALSSPSVANDGERLFQIAINVADCSESTRKAYQSDLDRFARFMTQGANREVLRWEALSLLCQLDQGRATTMVSLWRAWMRREGLSQSTMARGIQALRSITKALRAAGELEWKLEVKVPKVRGVRDVHGPNDEAWEALLGAMSGDSWIDVRDRAIIMLGGYGGLRASEMANIDLSDIDHRQRRVLVHGKGDKTRWVSLGEVPWRSLMLWMEVRNEHEDVDVDALFVSVNSKRASRDLIHDRVTAAARRAGLTGRDHVHPHALRHRMATKAVEVAAESGIPLVGVQKMLGHADIQTTMLYVDDADVHADAIARKLGEEG